MKFSYFGVLLSAFFAFACSQVESFRGVDGDESQLETSTDPLDQTSQIPVESEDPSSFTSERIQFGIFDDQYNFTRNAHANFSYAKQRFPVRSSLDSEIALLNSTSDNLAVRWKLLEEAKHSVKIQTLAFWGDESGWEFTKKLIELHKKGIKVQIIVDPISNLDPRAQYMFFVLQNNGVMVEGFEILYLFFLNGMSPGDKFADSLNKLNLRPHEKMFIVDSEDPSLARAIVGGSNISKHYFRIEPSKPTAMWRDRDVIVKGQIALDIAGHFDENYRDLLDIKRNHSLFNTDLMWEYYFKTREKYGYDSSKTRMLKPDQNPVIIQEFKRVANMPVQLKWIAADKIRPLRNRPRHKEWLIEDAYLDFVDSAKERISIMNAYFIPSEQMQEALKRAARRGVHVRILTNSRESSTVDLMPVAGRATYKNLLEVNKEQLPEGGKIEISEWMADEGLHNGEGHHHGKYAIFDGKASIVGSYNLEARSRLYNSENVIAVLDDEFSRDLLDIFEDEYSPGYSRKISLTEAESFRKPEGFIEIMRYGIATVATPML